MEPAAKPTTVEPLAAPAALLERLEWRYAVKKFDPARKVPEGTFEALLRAAVLAPSSFGLQPWRFVVVEDPAVRERLRAASWGQPQITEASHMVVFAARRGIGPGDVDRFLRRTAEVRGQPMESLEGFRKVLLGFLENLGDRADAWCARQTYIPLGLLLEAAAILGVDACPMEGIDPAAYDEALGLGEAGFTALAVCTLGYRAADDPYAGKPKVRAAMEEAVVRVRAADPGGAR